MFFAAFDVLIKILKVYRDQNPTILTPFLGFLWKWNIFNVYKKGGEQPHPSTLTNFVRNSLLSFLFLLVKIIDEEILLSIDLMDTNRG